MGTRTGEASLYCVMGLFTFGDAGADAAAHNGGLRVVNHADCRMSNLLRLFSTYTTIVYGE